MFVLAQDIGTLINTVLLAEHISISQMLVLVLITGGPTVFVFTRKYLQLKLERQVQASAREKAEGERALAELRLKEFEQQQRGQMLAMYAAQAAALDRQTEVMSSLVTVVGRVDDTMSSLIRHDETRTGRIIDTLETLHSDNHASVTQMQAWMLANKAAQENLVGQLEIIQRSITSISTSASDALKKLHETMENGAKNTNQRIEALHKDLKVLGLLPQQLARLSEQLDIMRAHTEPPAN